MTDQNQQPNDSDGEVKRTESEHATRQTDDRQKRAQFEQEEQEYLARVKQSMIDDDLFEPITHEDMRGIIKEARKNHQSRSSGEGSQKPRFVLPRRYRLFAIVLALFMVIQAVALLATTFSIPVVDFLITSHELSNDPVIKEDKEAIVIVDTGKGRGTGFVVARDGYIITNAHVVDQETTVTIGLHDQSLLTGEVIEAMPAVDLALIKVDQTFDVVLPLSETVPTLDTPVHFIGNPLRFNRIANAGTFIEREGRSSLDTPVYYLDAPVYRGNSGSPVINENGAVEGIVYATRDDRTYGKVGLVIPASVAADVFQAYLSPDQQE